MDGNTETPANNKNPRGRLETSDNKTELHMTFLPKSAEARQELVTLLIAIPLSLIGTSFLFFLLDAGSRVAV
jgi:hypothetical protein